MLRDSSSMKTIAFVTLLFLPASTIAAIFGTQFFSVNDSNRMTVSVDFWWLWAVAVPTTTTTWIFWRIWYNRKRSDKALGQTDVCKMV
jgi:Mg2+ and Co2+ transporter CorA